jgi:hypothetical protein
MEIGFIDIATNDEVRGIERRVYQRLSSYPNVATLLGPRTDSSINSKLHLFLLHIVKNAL